MIALAPVNTAFATEQIGRRTLHSTTQQPGGRVIVSDIVLLKELPEAIKSSIEAYTACVAGALPKGDYLETMRAAGFENVEVASEVIMGTGELESTIVSVNIRAIKPN